MRLFVALDIPVDVRQALLAFRRALPDDFSARWTSPESWHVTLCFIGEVPPALLPPVGDALRAVASGPLDLRIDSVGFFPSERSARVIWAGIHGEGLRELADAVRQALISSGVPIDTRPFQGHITLVRSRGDRLSHSIVATAKQQGLGLQAAFRATGFVLYNSSPDSSGSIYTPLGRFEKDVPGNAAG